LQSFIHMPAVWLLGTHLGHLEIWIKKSAKSLNGLLCFDRCWNLKTTPCPHCSCHSPNKSLINNRFCYKATLASNIMVEGVASRTATALENAGSKVEESNYQPCTEATGKQALTRKRRQCDNYQHYVSKFQWSLPLF